MEAVMGKRGPKPDPDKIARNAAMVRLYRRGDIDLSDLAARYGLHPNTVGHILQAADVTVRRGPFITKRPLPRKAAGRFIVPVVEPLQPPAGTAFCSQCDRLRRQGEVDACRSQWCSLKRTGTGA